MRVDLASSLLLSSALASLATAMGVTGAGERIFLYAAYQMEGLIGGDYKIAPGCGSAFQNSRCTFNQFLQYLYLDKTPANNIENIADDKLQPPMQGFNGDFTEYKQANPPYTAAKVVDILDDNFANLAMTLQRPRTYNGKKLSCVEMAKVSRCHRDATGYSDAISRVGEYMIVVRDWIAANPNHANAAKLISLRLRALKGITASVEVRTWERDNHKPTKSVPASQLANYPADSSANRLVWLNNRLNGPAVLMAAPNTAGLIKAGNPVILDAAATADAFGADTLSQHLQSYISNDFNGNTRQLHQTQLDQCKTAQSATSC